MGPGSALWFMSADGTQDSVSSTSRQRPPITVRAMIGDWRQCRLHGTQAEIPCFRASMRLIPTKRFRPVMQATSLLLPLFPRGPRVGSLCMRSDLEMRSGRITGPLDLAHGADRTRWDQCHRMELRLDRRLCRVPRPTSISRVYGAHACGCCSADAVEAQASIVSKWFQTSGLRSARMVWSSLNRATELRVYSP
jgi:hypothetical protein